MIEFYLQKEDGSHALVSEDKFREVYGEFVIQDLAYDFPGWRIRRLVDRIDAPAGTSVYLKGASGGPMPNVPIQMYYSTAPERPGSAPPNGLPEGVSERGDVGETDANGHSGWAWGDAYYWPNDPDPGKRRGPYCYWVADGQPCQCIDGVGMIGLSNHRRYDIHYQWLDHGPPPEPVPPDGELEERVTALEQQMVSLDHALQNIMRDAGAILAILEECDG